MTLEAERMQEIITALTLKGAVQPRNNEERKFISDVKQEIEEVEKEGGYVDFTPEFPDFD